MTEINVDTYLNASNKGEFFNDQGAVAGGGKCPVCGRTSFKAVDSYPTPGLIIIELDCKHRVGYQPNRDDHKR